METRKRDNGWMNEMVEDTANWFGEEMMRLEERDIPNPAGREPVSYTHLRAHETLR